MALLALEPGPMTAWTLTHDGVTTDALVDALDLGEQLDRLIRNANRAGVPLRIVVIEPSPSAGVMTRVAVQTIRRVLGIYDAVEAEWR